MAQRNAIVQLLVSLARSRGLSPARAREFAAAAAAESGLNPGAVNKSSGAAGLFQLLSPGYRSKAKALGGLFNPRANALAILPDYVAYWRTHPGARPGEAGAAVERSGMGAGFYARPLSSLGAALGGGGDVQPARALPLTTPAPVPAPGPDLAPLIAAANAAVGLPQPTLPLPSPAPARVPALSPARATPATGSRPTGKPSVAFLERYAAPYGLTVTSTTTGKHATKSYHYEGRAADFAGAPQKMAALMRAALKHPEDFSEAFYTGPGAPGFYIKDGKVYPNRVLDRSVATTHRNHVHLAR